MCQIQIVMSNELANDCIANFLELLDEGSQGNGDATGVFAERFHWKVGDAYTGLKNKKVNVLKDYIDRHSSNWLVGHNRFATQGSKEDDKNNHPFVNSTCVVVHNGHISNDDALTQEYALEYEALTDSAVIPALIEHFVNRGLGEVEAIKKTAENLEGSYSVVVRMKSSGNLYYFKNGSTNFHFARMIGEDGNTSIYGSTCQDSLKELGYIKGNGFFKTDLYKERVYGTPERGQIYQLVYKGDISVNDVCKFDIKPTNWNTGRTVGGTNWGEWDYNRNGWTQNKYGATYEEFSDDEDDIEDAFEQCLLELAHLSTIPDEMYLDELAKLNVNYHEGREQITIRNIPPYISADLKDELNATEWFDTDTSEGNVNVTISYKEVYSMKDAGLIYSSADGVSVCSCSGDTEPACNTCRAGEDAEWYIDDDDDDDSTPAPLVVMP